MHGASAHWHMEMLKASQSLAMTAILSGCRTMEPGKEVIDRSSLYDGANSVLYQARKAESSAGQAMINAAAAYRAGDPDQALCRYLRAPNRSPSVTMRSFKLDGSAVCGVTTDWPS